MLIDLLLSLKKYIGHKLVINKQNNPYFVFNIKRE